MSDTETLTMFGVPLRVSNPQRLMQVLEQRLNGDDSAEGCAVSVSTSPPGSAATGVIGVGLSVNRCQINLRERKVSFEGQVFSTDRIPEGTRFRGVWDITHITCTITFTSLSS